MSLLEYSSPYPANPTITTSKWYYSCDNASTVRPEYTGPDFDYRYNTLGFRSPEIIVQNPAVVSFGCSITQGVGVPEQLRFGNLVADQLALDHYSFACAGSDSLSVLRNVTAFFKNKQHGISTKLIVILWPHFSRVSICEDKNVLPKTLQSPNNHNYSDYHVSWSILSGRTYLLEYIKTVDLLCDLHDIKCIQMNVEYINQQSLPIKSFYQQAAWYKNKRQIYDTDMGRDTHPGIASHSKIYHIIKDICDKQLWTF